MNRIVIYKIVQDGLEVKLVDQIYSQMEYNIRADIAPINVMGNIVEHIGGDTRISLHAQGLMPYTKQLEFERPFDLNIKNTREFTVQELIEMLQKVPQDYVICTDSGFSRVLKEDFTIYHKDRKVSING